MRVVVVQGDITVEEVDAVVNAANSSLLGGGGVDGAIHRAAGPELLKHCKQVRESLWPDGLPPGEAAITPGGELPCRYVIHTVGPNRRAGQNDPAVLEACFRNSLALADEHGVESLAFPAVGAGVYGWEAEEVARAAARVLQEDRGTSDVEQTRFVLFDEDTTGVFDQVLGR